MDEIKHKTGFVILITLVATIGGFLFGFDSGVINGTVDGLRTAFHSESAGTGFNVASMLLGCAVGAFAAGRLADRFGRRNILMVAALCFSVCALGSGFARVSVEFVLYRLLGGLVKIVLRFPQEKNVRHGPDHISDRLGHDRQIGGQQDE